MKNQVLHISKKTHSLVSNGLCRKSVEVTGRVPPGLEISLACSEKELPVEKGTLYYIVDPFINIQLNKT